jgi:predicted enzyme related to lactoylglutathione lyase
MKLGHICQIEIRVNDFRAAVDFYSQAFDWLVRPMGADYAICDTGADPLGALMLAPSDSVPVGVSPYALVEDIDAVRASALELGGYIFVEKNEVPGQGFWLTILDPWENELAFWQPLTGWHVNHQGSGKNPFSWLEVPVSDLEAGVRFYSKLLGWSFQFQPGTDGLAFCAAPDRAVGVGLISGDHGRPMAGTTSYIIVADVHAAIERVAAAGGRVVVQPEADPGGGKFAVFLDPSGNRLGLSQPNG